MISPHITYLEGKKLVGKRISMSFADNKTPELWRSFMPQLKEISQREGRLLYSMEVYPEHFLDPYDPSATFEKWAAVELIDFITPPWDMELFILEGGLYAVFNYRGDAGEAPSFYRYIFETWLPTSGYILDHRPHLAVMSDQYKPGSPSSEEEIWIPVCERVMSCEL